MHLPPHHLSIALVSPQIAPNVGNVGRLCVASGTRLHLVRPFGFVLSDPQLKRAGLDYWARLDLRLHDELDAFDRDTDRARHWYFDSTGTTSLFDVDFRDGDVLVFGSETRGLSPALLEARHQRVVRIPQVAGERCLNLATSAGIALYAALAKLGRSPA